MSRRNQPYLPLYIQDFMTDEKLAECSAEATGVYIRIMCLMHKSDEYGVILLKQKDKQENNFACNVSRKLAKHLPYRASVRENALNELIDEGVLVAEGDKLLQKRMIRDNEISKIRAISGEKGGKKTQFAKANDKAKHEAKVEASLEIEYESIKDFESLFYYWENNKKGGKYKTKESRDRKLNELKRLTKNNFEYAKDTIFHCVDSGYKGFSNGSELYYKGAKKQQSTDDELLKRHGKL